MMTTINTKESIVYGRWLRLNEAAQYAGCAVNTFRCHLIKTGKVKPIITDFGKRYDKEEIDKFFMDG